MSQLHIDNKELLEEPNAPRLRVAAIDDANKILDMVVGSELKPQKTPDWAAYTTPEPAKVVPPQVSTEQARLAPIISLDDHRTTVAGAVTDREGTIQEQQTAEASEMVDMMARARDAIKKVAS